MGKLNIISQCNRKNVNYHYNTTQHLAHPPQHCQDINKLYYQQQQQPSPKNFYYHHQSQQNNGNSRSSGVINNMSIKLMNNAETDIDENKLIYRAEGNANIVLELLGKQRVLRIKKSLVRSCEKNGEDQRDNGPIGAADSELELRKLKRSIKYIKIMSLFFSEQFIFQPELIYLNLKNASALNQRLEKDRPVDRLEKEIRCDYAIIIPDVAFLPRTFFKDYQFTLQNRDTYCIEIKPKQGWSLFDDDFLQEEFGTQLLGGGDKEPFNFTSVRKCRYCAMQYLKLQKKTIDKVSKYCPLDLFSGKPLRMLSALKGLLGLPQNNLKIFKNGNMIYGEKIEKSVLNRILKELFGSYKLKEERKTIFINLLREILIKDYAVTDACGDIKRKVISIKKNKKKKNKNFLHFRNCDTSNPNYLPENCALKQIFNIQLLVKSYLMNCRTDRNGDGNEWKSPYMDNILQQFELFQKYNAQSTDPTMPINSTNSTNATNSAANRTRTRGNIAASPPNNPLQFQNFLDNLKDQEKYLFGATALDLSIMITFCKITMDEMAQLSSNADNHVLCLGGDDMCFLFNLTIMDLDPKSVNHHDKYSNQIKASHLAHKEFLLNLKE